MFNFTLPKGDKGEKGNDGEKGDPFKFSDFTPSQIEALKGEKGDKGDPFNFEDLTEEQLDTLKDNIGAVSNHEELYGLQGGDDGEHYHMTQAENYLTRTLLAGFFKLENESEPETDEKVYPATFTLDIGTYDPTPYLPYMLPKPLPKGTPPEWEMRNLSVPLNTNGAVGKMYYGTVPKNAGSSSENAVMAKISPNFGVSNNVTEFYLEGWSMGTSFVPTAFLLLEPICKIGSTDRNTVSSHYVYTTYAFSVYTMIFFGYDNTDKDKDISLYFGGYAAKASGVSGSSTYSGTEAESKNLARDNVIKGNSTWTGSISKQTGAGSAISYTWYPQRNAYMLLYSKGFTFLYSVNSSLNCAAPSATNSISVISAINLVTISNKREIKSGDITLNVGVHGGIAYSPDSQLLCVCGEGGTATSADSESWVIHTDAPKNLTDLSYREDLGCLFARCIDDKCFYVSGDGAEWQKLTSTPIPLDTITCVDFCKETGIYCAVGGTGKYAYFSRDLNTWVSTKITNGADIEAGSVIYMPDVKKYVLMPTSGSYYYTFDPSVWID